ncbi:MAG: hypothetical protein HY699_25080 [Deltaproteobacteria bacterium]|nr:hypothetical protein [Deltaproteobacteria bacterium]
MAEQRLSAIPEVDEAWNFSLFEAILNRRSRRFGLGMEIKEGPNAFKSPNDPVPLTELEEAMLITAGTGVSGLNLADMPHTKRPEKAYDLAEWDGMCNTMMEHVGRTWSSPCGNHGTELFYTNDEGLYFLNLREVQPEHMREFDDKSDRDKMIEFVRQHRVELSKERLDLPRNTTAIMSFNLWNVNMPGSTLFMPVTDLTEEFINAIMLMADLGAYLVDDLHGYVPCGNERWVKDGHVDNPMPLSYFERGIMTATSVEAGFIDHNIMLACQAMGLGGWIFGGVTSLVAMGGTPLCRGLGFHFEGSPFDPNQVPHPIGIDGLFESYRPPYFPNMAAAVDAVVAKKFGPKGTFNPSSSKPAPYLNRGDFLRQVPHTPEKTIQLCKDTCNYIWQTYGRFPAHADPMVLYAYCQVQHLELEFYDKYYRPGAYLRSHREHMKKWHKLEAKAGRKAA